MNTVVLLDRRLSIKYNGRDHFNLCLLLWGGENQGNGIEYLKKKEEGGANLVFPERMSSLMGFFFPRPLLGIS